MCSCRLQLATERIGSEKRPAEMIVFTEYENVSEYPLVCCLTLQMSEEKHCLQGCYFLYYVCDQKGAVLCSVSPPKQKVDSVQNGAITLKEIPNISCW